MERITVQPRENWQGRVEATGLLFHHTAEGLYWDESAYYKFNSDQIDVLDDAANELHQLSLAALEEVINKDRFSELSIPEEAVPEIKKSWARGERTLYGRFDFAYDGVNPPKLLEYNADTPTSLLEASVTQWYWQGECFKGADQFNSIHEKLVEAWLRVAKHMQGKRLYLTCVKENLEDLVTVTYLQDTAIESQLEASIIFIEDMGWDDGLHQFVDLDRNSILNLFKLYPWEWMLNDQNGSKVIELSDSMCWIEPLWKMILSNKGILPILWELNPGHPNLLECYFDGPHGMQDFVRKPKLSREGANVTIFRNGEEEAHSKGTYGEEGYIYQDLAVIPCFDGNYPVLGCWIVDGHSAGMGIRETKGPVTDNQSRFIPHLFE